MFGFLTGDLPLSLTILVAPPTASYVLAKSITGLAASACMASLESKIKLTACIIAKAAWLLTEAFNQTRISRLLNKSKR